MHAREVTSRGCLLALLWLALSTGRGDAQEAQIEHARQAAVVGALPTAQNSGEALALPAAAPTYEDNSFGEQQFLKRVEHLKFFHAFVELAAFYTSNVALTRVNPIADAFIVATAGLDYRRTVRPGLDFDASLRSSTYRYEKIRELDFTSVDAGAGLTYRASRLRGAELFARYNFTNLVSAPSGDTFFQNHAAVFGAQQTFLFGRAHYAFAGISAQFGFADPVENERDEYSAYAGYHLQVTRRLQADVFYKGGRFKYSVGGREDWNQVASVSARYELTTWCALSGSAYFTTNRSSRQTFNYDSGNVGGSIALALRF